MSKQNKDESLVADFRHLTRIVAVGMFFALTVTTNAQTTGSLTGVVSDAQGAVVAGANVTVTSLDRNQVAGNTETTDDGTYTFPALIPGNYKIIVERSGFSKSEVSPIIIELNSRQRIDVSLKVGDVGATIDVTIDSAPPIERDTSGVGTVINKDQVRNLPLFGRSPTNLITLAPGVSSTQDTSFASLSVNGSRTSNNEYTVDGISVVNASTGGAVGFVPSVEALREFRIQTAVYSAEFGRTSGATVTAVIDSGTDKYHGSLYEYFRNEAFNANNFFNNSRNIKRPADRYNQFGGTIGGPVPFIGKKTFFFFNYEGLRRTVPSTTTSTVPTAAFRSGDFSGSLGNYLCTNGNNAAPNTCAAGGTPVTVTATDGSSIQARLGQLFRPSDLRAYVNNVIPQSEWDAAAKAILANIPAPNLPGVSNNFFLLNTGKISDDQITARVDHNFNANARIFGRYSRRQATDSTAAVSLPGVLNNGTGLNNSPGQQFAFGYNQTFSPTIFNEFNFGYLVDKSIIDPPAALNSPADLGFQTLPQLAQADNAYYPPSIAFASPSGFTSLGLNANTYRRQNTYTKQISDSITFIHGGHTFKTGAQVRLNRLDIFNPGANFSGVYTVSGNTLATPTGSQVPVQNNTTTAFAAFLLGRVDAANYAIPQPLTSRRNYNVGIFIQDDWKVTPKLTLNLGLRYEYESPSRIVDNIYSRIDQNTGKLLVAGVNASETLDLEADKWNFGPRVGFAYSANDKTVIRGAYGLFYSQIFSNLGGVVGFPGFTITQQFNSRGAGLAQTFSLSQGIPLLTSTTVDPFIVERNASITSPLVVFPEYYSISPLPETHQLSIGVQRILPWGFVGDVAYVGSRSTHLPYAGTDANAVPPALIESVAAAGTTLAIQQARRFPTIGPFATSLTSDPFENVGSSRYNSAQFKLTRRFSRGFGLTANYTLSKSTDDGSGIFNSTQPEGLVLGIIPTFDRSIEQAISAFDRTHVFTAAVQFELPFGKGKYFLDNPSSMGGKIARAILGDWQINTLTSIRSGLPLTVQESGLTSIGGNFQQRPNTNGTQLKVVNVPGPNGSVQYFQPVGSADFPYTPTGPLYTGAGATRRQILPFTIGTEKRNSIRMPTSYNTDFSLIRRFRFNERMNFNIRVEAFNVFNQTTLLFSNTNVTLPVIANASNQGVFNPVNSFGQTTSAAAARRMQFVLRFEF